MASLLERIQNIGQQGPQPAQKGIEEVLRQRSGKARARTGPGASTIGEQAAIGAGRAAIGEQSFAERLQDVQARGREQALTESLQMQEDKLRQQQEMEQQRLSAEAAMTREGIRAGEEEARIKREGTQQQQIKKMNAQSEQKLRDLASQKNTTLDNIFADYEFDTADLEDRRDGAELEQLGFLLALQDRKYLDSLEQIGVEQKLYTDMAFDRESQRLVLGEGMSELLTELGFRAEMDARDRDFQEQLGRIDIDTAIAIMQQGVSDFNERSKWEAIGTGASTVTKYYAGEE